MPFWLTECGHVMCDHHFSQKQCSSCGTKGVQTIPLERKLEKPMSDWFSQVPSALDTLTYAIKFQQETMAASLRHYKSKYLQHKALHLRYKNENEELKRAIGMLKSQLRETGEEGWQSSRSSDVLNHNGKRTIAGPPSSSSSSHSLRAGSSPFLGPNRLIPPFGKHPQPSLLAKHAPEGSRPQYTPSGRQSTSIPTTRPSTSCSTPFHFATASGESSSTEPRPQHFSSAFHGISTPESSAVEQRSRQHRPRDSHHHPPTPEYFTLNDSRNNVSIRSRENLLVTPLSGKHEPANFQPMPQSRSSTAVNAGLGGRRFTPASSSRT